MGEIYIVKRVLDRVCDDEDEEEHCDAEYICPPYCDDAWCTVD